MRIRNRSGFTSEYCNGIAYMRSYLAKSATKPSRSYPTAYNVPIGEQVTETIMDETGPASKAKPCTHTRVAVHWDGPDFISFSHNGNSVSYDSQGYQGKLWAMTYGTTNLTSMPSVSSASDFHGPDWFSLMADMRTKLDQIQPRDFFLAELLVEYKTLLAPLKLLLNPTSGVKSLLDLAKAIKKKPRYFDKMKTISNSAASGYLGYTFGIKPAISDIRSTFNAHKRVTKRLRYLRENAGQWVPVRVRTVVHSSVTPGDLPTWPYGTRGSRLKTKEKLTVATISCLAQVRRSFNHMDVWSAYLDYFGVRDVLQLGWELVPFSFVVDWFTNFQERLDNSLRPLRSGSPYTAIKNMCFTTQKILVEEAFASPNGWYSSEGMYLDSSDWTRYATRVTETYDRQVHLPDTSGVVDLTNLGLFHAITGGALVIQRFR